MKKGTKKVLIILLFVVTLSYFAFTQLFFDPFEGSYMDRFDGEPAVALEYVVPRNIDFFAHKRGLLSDFGNGDFPVPDVWEEIALARTWKDFERTPLYQGIVDEYRPGERVDQIRELTAGIPVLDPVIDIAGRDIAVFGRVAGRGFTETETAVVFLGSMLARLSYETMGSDLLRSVFGIPGEVEVDEMGIRHIKLEDGTELWVYRELDLFVVGTGPLLVGEVAELLILGERDGTLGYSRQYHDTVAREKAKFAGAMQEVDQGEVDLQSRLQFHAQLDSLLSLTDGDERFLETRGQISRWLMGKLFNPRYFRDVSLDVDVGETIGLRGMLEFDSEAAEAAETGFYKENPFELRRAMDRVAGLVPEDTFFLMAFSVDMQKFLPQLVTGLTEVDPAARELLDDIIQSVRRARPDFRSTNAIDAARNIARFLGDHVVVALKRDTYFGEPESPTPLIALFLQVTDRGPDYKILDQTTGDPSKMTGYNGFIYPIMRANSRLQTDSSKVSKWFNVWHETQGSPEERWIQDVLVSGTGLRNVSFGIIDPKSKSSGPWTFALVLSPRIAEREVVEDDGTARIAEYGSGHELMTDFIKLSVKGGDAAWAKDNDTGGQRPVKSLLQSEKYRGGAEFLDGFASVALYTDGAGWKKILRDYSQSIAEASTEPEWETIHAELEAELLAGDFAQWADDKDAMPESVREQFDDRILRRKEEIDRRWKLEDVPRAREEFEASLAWVDLFEEAFLAARIDDTDEVIELRARIHCDVR